MPTLKPMLSILIPSIPERMTAMALPLIAKIQAQIDAEPMATLVDISGGAPHLGGVEILCLLDNKTRSIGLKRDDLVQRARGTWLAFVDDDDDVSPTYIQKILETLWRLEIEIHTKPKIDVIVFDQWTTIDGGERLLIRHGLEFENTQLGPTGATRKPWHHNVWRSSVAKIARFPDASYGEDAHWLKQLWGMVTIEGQLRIEGDPLHYYRFDSRVTAAEHTFPEDTCPRS